MIVYSNQHSFIFKLLAKTFTHKRGIILTTTKRSRTGYYIAAVIIVIIIVIAGYFAYQYFAGSGGSSGGGTKIDIYAGEYGFGNSAGSVTSPGPTLTFKAGDTVTVTLHNVGTVPHNWAIVTDKTDGSTNYAFSGAVIGSASNAVAPGASSSATFTVGNAGSYYYICQVDGHVSLGMWGTVTVQ